MRFLAPSSTLESDLKHVYFFFFSSLLEGKEEEVELEVFNFTGEGGVALSMYNTDEVQILSISSSNI